MTQQSWKWCSQKAICRRKMMSADQGLTNPAHCLFFYTVCEIRMAFTFLNDWKKSKEEKCLIRWKLYKGQISVSISKVAPLVPLRTAYGGFHAATAGVSSYDHRVSEKQTPEGTQSQKYLLSGPWQKEFSNLCNRWLKRLVLLGIRACHLWHFSKCLR